MEESLAVICQSEVCETVCGEDGTRRGAGYCHVKRREQGQQRRIDRKSHLLPPDNDNHDHFTTSFFLCVYPMR